MQKISPGWPSLAQFSRVWYFKVPIRQGDAWGFNRLFIGLWYFCLYRGLDMCIYIVMVIRCFLMLLGHNAPSWVIILVWNQLERRFWKNYDCSLKDDNCGLDYRQKLDIIWKFWYYPQNSIWASYCFSFFNNLT